MSKENKKGEDFMFRVLNVFFNLQKQEIDEKHIVVLDE